MDHDLRKLRRPRWWLGYTMAVSTAIGSTLGCGGSPAENATEKHSQPSRAEVTAEKQGAEKGFGIDLAALKESSPSSTSVERVVERATATLRLVPKQIQFGLRHVYDNGESGQVLLAETVGGGCGWLDYDCDGFPDLYLNQGGDLTSRELQGRPLDQLYRNVAGADFVGIAERARIREPFYSQGVAIADFNNDGFEDVYVTNLERNTLWHNLGDGTFEEVAGVAAVADSRWSTSAAWGDLDRDGNLDLYVCNYCVYDPTDPKECKDPAGFDTLCNPGTLEPWADACFMNRGDGTFVEESQQRGLVGAGNRALGVAIADFDNDLWPDIYVANDTTENFLFVNQGQGLFVDEAKLRGCAVDREGATQASMGVAVADLDQNGFLDIYCTHFYEESNTLYSNLGPHGFRDITTIADLHRPTLSYLGFGAVFEDFNSDGTNELLVANGHVNNSSRAADPNMRPQLFTQADSRRWVEISDRSGEYFQQPRMGRSVALADFDVDGDQDVIVVNQNAEAALLSNESSSGGWFQLRLIGTSSNRTAVGARVELSSGDGVLTEQICGGTSYCASPMPILQFGLGSAEGSLQVKVFWPSGLETMFEAQADQRITLVEPLGE